MEGFKVVKRDGKLVDFDFNRVVLALNNAYEDYAVSVNQIEEWTGFDFFVNLPGKVGDDAAAAVEAQKPTDYKVWNL